MMMLLMVTWRTALLLPSQNLMALDDEERRQLVTVTFSVGSTGPQADGGIKADGVVAGLDGAVGDADVLAAVGVDAVGPHRFFLR